LLDATKEEDKARASERISQKIDAGFAQIACESDKDFVVAMAHVADCIF